MRPVDIERLHRQYREQLEGDAMFRELMRWAGNILFLAALMTVIFFFLLGMSGQIDRPEARPERHSGRANGGSP